MEETKNLKLKKPLDADAPDLPLYVGDNMEVLDGAIGKPAAGTYTSASKSNAENIAALDTEVKSQADSATALAKIVGTPANGNYTSAGNSNAANINVLDTRAKSNADAASSAASAASGANSVATKGLSNQAQIETAGKATNAHTTGEFVIIDNALYKIKSDVAAGDAWTVGSNIESTTLGSELAALNNNLTKGFQADANDPGGYIGMKVEGGGTIFFDYKIGFRGSDVNVAPLTATFKTYHVDPVRNMVICDNPTDTSKRDRFYVVSDYDIGDYKHGTNLMWSNGTSGSLYKSVGTATGFGTGKSNTEKCIAAAKTDGLLEWNNNAYNCIWHYVWKGDWQRTTDRGTNQWFVPSKDELALLCDMQYAPKTRTSYDQKTALNLLPIAFYSYYWSSSESSATVAFNSNFCDGNAANANNKNNTNNNHVRLVRTY